MRLVHCAIVFAVLLAWSAFCLADDAPGTEQPKEAKKVSQEEIDRLVEQLGDKQFAARTAARKKLEEIGEPALGSVKQAAEKADDAEVRAAAAAVVKAIEVKLSGVLRVFAEHGERVNGVAITSDGKQALSASWDGHLRHWNLATGELIKEMHGHQAGINSVAVSSDGKRAITGGRDQSMILWDLENAKEVRSFKVQRGGVWDVAFSPDGTKALAGCGDGFVRLWDLDSGKELLALEAQKGGYAWTVAFTPDGKQAVTGGGNALLELPTTDESLRLWDLTTGKEIRQFQGHTKDIRRVAISPDGKQLLSGSFDGTMRLWDIQTGKEVKCFNGPGHFVESVAFTSNGKRVICSYGPRVVEAIQEEDARCSLRLFDLNTGKELKQFKGHTAPILSLAISADGRYLVSGSADRTMRLWEMPK